MALLLAGQQGAGLDDQILEKGDRLLDEAKSVYEDARTKGSAAGFVDAGFKLEEARIKFLVLQEIGAADKQKIATDRLRAINQLSKLIHDGKVAITGNPAEAPAARSPDLPPLPTKSDPSTDPTPAPGKPPTDVTKRVQVPDPARQREAEKLVKDLFKDQYAKKAPSDRQALAKILLSQAEKSSDDAVALWVLYREALDAAIQACDVRTVTASIEGSARVFDVDAMSMKNAAFMAVGKNAKTPAELSALSKAQLELIDDLIAADQYDAADKSATAALQNAKRAGDAGLAVRATTSSKEVAEAKAKFQAMKNALQTLAKSPEDPGSNSQMGQFLCFVKGNWDLGLRFVIKGSDATLKSLAEKELALTALETDRVPLADGWYDLADKEKSPLCRKQMTAHAAAVYESALPGATGLVRTKIEKRLSELTAKLNGTAAAAVSGTDLIAFMDPKKDSFAGTWERTGTRIGIANGGFSRIEIPYEPPDEYDLRVVIEVPAGADTETVLLLTRKGRACAMSIYPSRGNGAIYNSGDPVRFPTPIVTGKPFTVLVQVRNDSLKALIDDKPCLDWKPDWTTLGPHVAWNPRNAKLLGFGATGANVSFVSAQLVEVTGHGRKSR